MFCLLLLGLVRRLDEPEDDVRIKKDLLHESFSDFW
jgi:hypothetical protein